MAHDVFISYSSLDRVAADTICVDLERRGISCWMAPRDIVPGMPWAESIVDALEASGIMVLVYSASANVSVQIHREVERAVHKNIPLLPIRIEEAVPTRSMEYFISSTHWFDAIAPPLESHLERFAKGVAALLARRSHNKPPAPPGGQPPAPDPHPAAPSAPVAPPPLAPAYASPVAPAPVPAAESPAPPGGIPAVLGNYDVGSFLVQGRYGSVVHAGSHRLMGHPVAIRIFRPPAKGRGQAVRERFLREARSAQVQHPNIVHVRDFGEVDDVLYVVTDLLPGCSLSELLTTEGPLAPAKLLTFVKELIDATTAIHRQNGLISGLRPDMIRVVREAGSERIAISSAGINLAQELMAVMNEASLRGEAGGTTLSELSYVAPELLMGKTADVRSDAFTLGVLAYQMATGKPPFHAGSLPELMGAMLMTAPADLAGIRADIPADAAAVIMRCLKADPVQRFATAAEVFEAWQHATAG